MQALLLENSEKDSIQFVGNRTECALLILLKDWGANYKEIRDQHHSGTERIYGFTSERKMASILIRTPSSLRLYNKAKPLTALQNLHLLAVTLRVVDKSTSWRLVNFT